MTALQVSKASKVAALAVLSLWTPIAAAHAGTPWWCTCQGQAKRFIASSHICEHDLAERTGKKVKQCSGAQFVAWNRKACRLEGCTPRQ